MLEILSYQEEEVMKLIWKIEKGYIKDIQEAGLMSTPYTTIASIVKNLERKQYVLAEKMGNAYIYRAIVKQDDYSKEFMDKVVGNYFNDSYKNLVNFFVEKEKINVDELEELLALIKKNNNG
jgi:BlaI family penicillinase repressor